MYEVYFSAFFPPAGGTPIRLTAESTRPVQATSLAASRHREYSQHSDLQGSGGLSRILR